MELPGLNKFYCEIKFIAMLHVDIYFCTFYFNLGINKMYLDQIFIMFVGLACTLNKFISVYLLQFI